MQINAFSFHTFYIKLAEKLLDVCFIETDRKNVSIDSAAFWGLNSKEFKKGKKLFEIAYAEESQIKGEKYLYNMKSEYPLNYQGFWTINDLALTKCLEFIGYSIPKKITNQSFRDHEQVKVAVAFQFFAESEMKDYFDKHLKDFVVFDHATNSVIESAFIWDRKSYKTLAKEESQDIVFEITESELLHFQSQRRIQNFVIEYFELLRRRDFKAAMDFWEPHKQEYSWNNDVQEFQRMFWNLDNITARSIILVRFDKGRDAFMVYINYVQTKSYYTAEDYEIFLKRTQIDYSREVFKKLDSFLARAKRNKFDISEMSFQSLFDYSVIDKMHLDGAYDQTRLKKVFPEHNRVAIGRIAECLIIDSEEEQLKFRSFDDITIMHDHRFFNG